MTCPYITSLDKPCGRTPERLGEQHCDLHTLLAQFDAYDFDNPTPIVPPRFYPPLAERILFDVLMNLEHKI